MNALDTTEIFAGYWWLWSIMSVIGIIVIIHYNNRLSSTYREILAICEDPIEDDTDKEELVQRIIQIVEKYWQLGQVLVKFGVSGLVTIMLLIVSAIAFATNFKQ